MSTPRYIADLHLGHRNIYKYRTVFESTLHNDLFFLEVLRRVSTKRDTTYFLGDIVFNNVYLKEIKNLPGNKVLILGNHDSPEYCTIKELVNTFDDVCGVLKKHNMWLTHIPVHAAELRGKVNVHGHVHQHSIPDERYLNVSVDSSFMKFYPRTLEEVRKAFQYQQDNKTHYAGMSEEEAHAIIKTNKETQDIYYSTLAESKRTTLYIKQ